MRAAAVGLAAALAGTSALACEPSYTPLTITERSVAAAMVRSAASVDVVQAARAKRLRWRDPDAARGRTARVPYEITLTTVQRLKGSSSRSWKVRGFVHDDGRPAQRLGDRAVVAANDLYKRAAGKPHDRLQNAAYAAEAALHTLESHRQAHAGYDRGEFHPHGLVPDSIDLNRYVNPAGDCSSPISVNMGARYLVFRDRAGRLSGGGLSAVSDGRRIQTSGPAFVELVDDKDPWLLAVKRAAKGRR